MELKKRSKVRQLTPECLFSFSLLHCGLSFFFSPMPELCLCAFNTCAETGLVFMSGHKTFGSCYVNFNKNSRKQFIIEHVNSIP